MRFGWNDDISAWMAAAAWSEAGSGPPGPAGVSVLRAGETAISLCTMTGRVTSARVSARPDAQEQALLELVFAIEPGGARRWSARGGDSGAIELAARPAAGRATVTTLAHDRDAVAHIDFGPNVWASYLARLELVRSLMTIREQIPTGPTLVPAAEVSAAVDSANMALDRLCNGPTARAVAHRLSDRGLAATLRVGLDTALASVRGRTADLTGPAELLRDELAARADAAVVDAAVVDAAVTAPAAVPHAGARWAAHHEADTASRAGWAALQQARAGGERSCRAAQLIFAELTAAWWTLGARYRSCWASQLADRDAARRALNAAGSSPAEVEAHAFDTVVPPPEHYLPPALWTLTMPVAHLLPASTPLVAS